MIGAWMLHASLVGLLLWGYGMAAERLLLGRRFPHRLVWAGTLIGSVLIPLGVGRRGKERLGEVSVGRVGEGFGQVPEVTGWADWATAAEGWLLAVWMLASIGALAVLFRSVLRVRTARAGWRRGRVAGSEVLISRVTGPAVVGMVPGRIVVPEWIMELDEGERRLLMEHEREHLRTGDPHLLVGAWLAVIALPWNAGVWLQWIRLREAVELDCDARVIDRFPGERKRYLDLLLQVAERVARQPVGTALLAASVPPLERRLRVLAGIVPVLSGGRRFGLSAAMVGLMLWLHLLPAPPEPQIRDGFRAARPAATPPPAGSPSFAAADAPPRLLNRHEAPAILKRVYPADLRSAGVGGTVVLGAYVEHRGEIARSAVIESSGNPELDQAALRAIEEFRFQPGRKDGRPASGWAQQPVTFVAYEQAPVQSAATGDESGQVMARLAVWRAPARPHLIALR